MRRLQTHNTMHPIHFLYRFYVTHHALIKLMKKTGLGDWNGLCFGVSCRAVYDILADQQHFDDQLKALSQLNPSDIKNNPQLMRFLDSIRFAQNPEKNTEFIHHYPRQDIALALRYIKHKEQKKLPIIRSAHFSGIYSQNNLIAYFMLIQRAAQRFPHPFVLQLRSVRHAWVVHFNHQSQLWRVIDVNQLPGMWQTDHRSIAVQVAQSANSGGNINFIFRTSAYTLKKNQPNANKFWKSIQNNAHWKTLHNAKQKYCSVSDRFNKNSWLQIAALDGLTNEVRQLLTAENQAQKNNMINEHNNDQPKKIPSRRINKNTNDTKLLALSQACYNNHIPIVKLLLAHGVSAKSLSKLTTVLEHSVTHNNIAQTKLLLKHGANPNDLRLDDALLNTIEENPEHLALLEQYGFTKHKTPRISFA